MHLPRSLISSKLKWKNQTPSPRPSLPEPAHRSDFSLSPSLSPTAFQQLRGLAIPLTLLCATSPLRAFAHAWSLGLEGFPLPFVLFCFQTKCSFLPLNLHGPAPNQNYAPFIMFPSQLNVTCEGVFPLCFDSLNVCLFCKIVSS